MAQWFSRLAYGDISPPPPHFYIQVINVMVLRDI